MHLTVDGFATPYLLHTVRAVEDASSSGSVAMINSDVLAGRRAPQRRLCAALGQPHRRRGRLPVRDGSRDRTSVSVPRSAARASSLVVEGPLGRRQRGSWLVSARQCYLDLIIHRLADEQVSSASPTRRRSSSTISAPPQRLDLTMLAGRSRLNEPEERNRRQRFYRRAQRLGRRHRQMAADAARTRAQRRRAGRRQPLPQRDDRRHELDNGREQQLSGRSTRASAAAALELDAGGEADVLRESRRRQRPLAATTYRVINDYSGDGTPSRALRIGPMGSSRPGSLSCRASARIAGPSPARRRRPRGCRRSGAFAGTLGSRRRRRLPAVPGLRAGDRRVGQRRTCGPERATQLDLGVEQRIGQSACVPVTVYDREERDLLRRPGAETRLVAGRVVRASRRAVTRTGSTARRAASRSWFSASTRRLLGLGVVSFGRNRYRDTVERELLGRSRSAPHHEPLRALPALAAQA